MTRLKVRKRWLLLVAVAVVSIVAIIAPEYAENLARAFMLILGVSF